MEYENFSFVEAVKFLADPGRDRTSGDGILKRGKRKSRPQGVNIGGE